MRIYPPIGIARVGNSVDENGWFYGPEVPGRFNEPKGGFKDAQGAVKRQVSLLLRFFVHLDQHYHRLHDFASTPLMQKAMLSARPTERMALICAGLSKLPTRRLLGIHLWVNS